MNFSQDPHKNQPVLTAGEPIQQAKAAMLLLHGRGAQADDILTLATELDLPRIAYFAPQAEGNAWYPNRFMAPLADNEPWLSSALAFINRVFSQILQAGIPAEKIILLGFSQGACLTLEYAARNPRRYGGIVGLSGGLIGPENLTRETSGSLSGTPVFLGCSDVDPHIPKERVDQAAQFLSELGGEVTERIYPQMGHMVNQDEMDFVRNMAFALLPES